MREVYVLGSLMIAGCFVAHSQENNSQRDMDNLLSRAILDVVYIDGLKSEEERKIASRFMTSKDVEVISNIRVIRQVEIAYEGLFDAFISVDAYPPPSSTGNPRKWETSKSGDFQTLGWAADGEVRGTYWVTTTDTNFTVFGIIDADGDGSFTTYTATRSDIPVLPEIDLNAPTKIFSKAERTEHIEKIKKLYTILKSTNQNAELNEQLIIDVLVMSANTDASISRKEKAALKQYIKALDSDYSIEQSVSKMQKRESGDVQKKSKRAEVPVNVKGIKRAEISYEGLFDAFISVDAYPPPSSTGNPRKWETSKSGDFQTLGWAADGEVRGTYWVTTTDTNFTVFGIIDVDGDGQFATYRATKSENPNAPITDRDIY